MPRSLTDIANEAIADLPASPITSLTDGSKEARECSRHLSPIVAELIAYHDWSFVNRRVVLAEVTNDRPGEWAKAYSLPNAHLAPIRLVRPASTTAGLSVATGAGVWTGDIVVTPMLYWPTTQLTHAVIDYEIADGVLYTNLEQAILEYSIDAVEPAKWGPLFAKAVIAELAARIYRPILGEKGDTMEVREKRGMAMRYLDRAVADDLNRNPRQRDAHVAEGTAARLGHAGGVTLWRR